MTQLSESVQWSRRRRANKVAKLRRNVRTEEMDIFEDLEKQRQFQEDCRQIWIQSNGNRKLYHQLKEARRKSLGLKERG